MNAIPNFDFPTMLEKMAEKIGKPALAKKIGCSPSTLDSQIKGNNTPRWSTGREIVNNAIKILTPDEIEDCYL